MTFLLRVFRHLSIRGLVLLSVAVTLLPMLVGLVSSIFAVERLADMSAQAVQALAQQGKQQQGLQQRLGEFADKGLEYLRTQEADARSSLEMANGQLAAQLRSMAAAGPADGPVAYGLEALARDQQNVFDAIISRYPPRLGKPANGGKPPPGMPVREDALAVTAAGYFDPLKDKGRELALAGAKHMEQEAASLAAQSAEVKQRLLTGLALLLPISCALLTLFVYLLHNPIQQIDHVIRALGTGNFSQPVRVVGTGDVEFLGERLEWLRTRLNDLEMAKQRFVRNVSHEIKTPLATIHEGTDLLLDEVVGELNQEQKDIARILVNSADKLDRLIAELINYSQVSARRECQKVAQTDMRALVVSVLDDYHLQLRGKSITASDSLEPLALMGNAEQLRVIVDNLLSNAIKYSPTGGEIRVSLRKVGGHLELEVEDDGPGIDPDERGRVFEPFFQGRAARELGVKGTGFGLAIVAECVANHHGKVEVLESHGDDAGARIRVQIPMQAFA